MVRRLFAVFALLGAAILIHFSSPAAPSSAAAGLPQAPGQVQGVVKDPKGAVVAGASVALRHETTGATQTAATDSEGKFTVTGLAPGRWTVSVEARGFKTAQTALEIESDKKASVEIKLEIAETRAEVSVGAKGSVAPNSNADYRALREAKPAETYSVANLSLKRDVGTIALRSGTVTFLAPVLERTAIGVFAGDGELTLTPAVWTEKNYMRFLTGKDSFAESFDRMVLVFSDDTFEEIKKSGAKVETPARAADVLRDHQKRVRRSTERPRSMIEAFLNADDVENIEAELLAALYNPNRRGAFNAYIFGKKYSDLRFHIRPEGVFPGLPAPEEVALVYLEPGAREEGIVYLAHKETEYKQGTASSEEDKRIVDVEHYRIETVIRGERLTSSADIRFKALGDGDRMVRFGLLPNLRVTRVAAGEREIDFIQERRQEDGAFYALLPEPTVKGKLYTLTVEYGGDKVLEDAGGGNFAVGARTSWYPSVNAFTDRATFDLTFKIPNRFVLVSVGKLVKEGKEGEFAVSHWVSDVPLAVAGFNYGNFKKKSLTDDATKYLIEGYATSELPDYMRGAQSIGGMSPVRMMDTGMNEAQNSMRIFTHWFGPLPYGRVAITQQPQMNFGQSWPSLVYLPIISFFDSTQRWQMFGLNSGLTSFIQEVTSHEVAHQWWGHIVGWASFHDQWLSEGFADFSASLFLQATNQTPDRFLKFWDQQRKAILDKNEFGWRANDVGPIWTGLRLDTTQTRGVYSRLVYPKGSYVLHMLRWMMYDAKTNDERFIAMMRDFVQTHYNRNASTESFKRTVEKHMTEAMDLEGNKRMDWFFRQWVFGTEVPRYRLDYSFAPAESGSVMFVGKLTQSEVSDNFRALVPVYLDFGGKVMRLGEARAVGNVSVDFQIRLPQKPKRAIINYHHDILAVESVSVGK
ncbi:MAG: carboxypeptidase regulatory-like domain-containing protein [Blastocatellales bacterium]|nr:carboxypeptidase regulatory-like domain-containing protein [Blastocatellales bacterium]